MQKAKQAAENFLSKDGKHNTTVDQEVQSAVEDTHIRPHKREIVTTAVDKEIHQDHYQTRIQPVTTTERLPEEHSHVFAPIQHTSHEHGNETELRTKLEQDAKAFANTSVTHETTHSTETAPTITGSHIHHHVHEHIQPVIHKDVIEPKVIHTTIPVHETHHAAPIHHEPTTLPTQTLEEFTAAGGSPLQSKPTTTLREFEGCPGPYNKERQLPNTALHPDSSSLRSDEDLSQSKRFSDGSDEGHYTYGDRSTATGITGVTAGSAVPKSATNIDAAKPRTDTTMTDASSTSRRRSLMDKLNPLKDSDGDGKKGIMS